MYPAGQRRLSTRFRFGLRRKILTSDEAEELGLHPIRDPSQKMQIYTTTLYRTLANKWLIDELGSLKNEDGTKLIAYKNVPQGYVQIEQKAFQKYLWKGEEETKEGKQTFLAKGNAYADPRVASVLNKVLMPGQTMNVWLRRYRKAQNIVKRMIMLNPLIHGTNIFSDVLDEANFDFITTSKVVYGGKVPKKLIEKGGFESVDDLRLDAVKHGISADTIRRVSSDMYEGMREIETRNPILKPFVALKEWSDKTLWGHMVGSSQLYIYLLETRKLMKKNPEMNVDQAKELAAHFTNDLLGTLPSTVFTKDEALASNIFLFARNWTVSNLRLLSGGAPGGLGGAKGMPGWLRHKGLTEDEAKKLTPLYEEHLAKGVLGLVLQVIVANTLIKSWKEGKPSIWIPWEAEEGHWLDIDSQMRDNRGRKIYIKPPLFRYMGDYIGYYALARGDPKVLQNKMEPITKQLVEQFVNYSMWQRKKISEGEGLEALGERGLYFLRGTTPAGTVYGVTSPATETWEKFLPLTGTWARHGISPELILRYESLSKNDRNTFFYEKLSEKEQSDFIDIQINQQLGAEMPEEQLNRAAKYAKKLIEFRNEMRRKWRPVDKRIDKLILQGDVNKAYELMNKESRYVTFKSMQDRVTRVLGGMPY